MAKPSSAALADDVPAPLPQTLVPAAAPTISHPYKGPRLVLLAAQALKPVTAVQWKRQTVLCAHIVVTRCDLVPGIAPIVARS